MTEQRSERRRVQRIKLLTPLRGTAGASRIFVVDVSLRGLRCAHQEKLGAVGDRIEVAFDSEGWTIRLGCQIRWTKAQPSPGLHHSGVEIHEADTQSTTVLASLIESHVTRALDEQKANARGIPAVAALSYQTGRVATLMRHERNVAGIWRTTETKETRQPMNGFTVSSDLTEEEVIMLRKTFDSGDAAARELIRQMAAVSISNPEGIPTRKYEP